MPKEIIALDVGERRIGVARANNIARLPEPLPVIDRQTFDSTSKITDKLRSYEPSLILIGLPKNLKGDDTEQTAKSQAFFEELSSSIDLPLKFVDETLSTVEAEKWRVKYPEADEDSLAACIILERYFSGEKHEL